MTDHVDDLRTITATGGPVPYTGRLHQPTQPGPLSRYAVKVNSDGTIYTTCGQCSSILLTAYGAGLDQADLTLDDLVVQAITHDRERHAGDEPDPSAPCCRASQ